MKITGLIAVLFFSFCAFTSNAATTPADPSPAVQTTSKKITAKDIEKLTGKKLNFFQKLKLKLVQSKLLRKYISFGDGAMTEQQKKWAKWSMILGIGSLVLLLVAFIPYLSILGLLSVPASILAIIFGVKSLKGNSNAQGIVGIVTGGVTLLFILLALIWLFTFFEWGWG